MLHVYEAIGHKRNRIYIYIQNCHFLAADPLRCLTTVDNRNIRNTIYTKYTTLCRPKYKSTNNQATCEQNTYSSNINVRVLCLSSYVCVCVGTEHTTRNNRQNDCCFIVRPLNRCVTTPIRLFCLLQIHFDGNKRCMYTFMFAIK